MNKVDIFREHLEVAEQLGIESITIENFNNILWPRARKGLAVMRKNGIILIDGDKHVFPCLVLSDSDPLTLRQNEPNSTTYRNDFAQEFVNIRMFHIAVLTSTLGDEKKPIRVYFTPECCNIKPLVERMAREEIIRIRR